MTIRASVQDATFSMRGQMYRGHYLNHYVMEYSCGVMGKEVILHIFFLPRKFLNDGERRAQVSTFSSLQLIIAGFTLFI